MSTDLKLLIDEMVPVELIRRIEKLSALRSLWAGDVPELVSKDDDIVLAYANKEKRILFTLERRFERHGVCKGDHVGIIILTVAERHEAARGRVFERFIRSGHRKQTRDTITRVSHGKAVVTNHSGKPKTYQPVQHDLSVHADHLPRASGITSCRAEQVARAR